MQARKSKKKTAVFQPWYMVWVFYILNLFSRQAQVAHIPPQLPSSLAPPEKMKKSPASTHKKISNEKMAAQPKAHSHSSQALMNKNDVPPIPPALRFSAGFDKPVKEVKKVKSDESLASNKGEKIAQKSPPQAVSVADYSLIKTRPLWEEARETLLQTIDQISNPLPAPILESPVNQLIDNLAFLYRYNLTIHSMRAIVKKGFDEGKLEQARINLVHNTDSHLFDRKEIAESKAVLAAMSVAELDELGPRHFRIDGFDMTDAMQNVPLHTFMAKLKEKKSPGAEEKEVWLTKGAIPLLNLLFHIHEHTKNDQHRLACNHAIKMLVIIIGEYCPAVGDIDFDKERFNVSDDGTYASFIKDCKKLRNFYAHKIPREHTAWVEEELFKLRGAALKVNEAHARNIPEIGTRLSPHSVKTHYMKEVSELKPSSQNLK